MKTWEYSITTNSIWFNEDVGTVTAPNRAEALKKAKGELHSILIKMNSALKSYPLTKSLIIEIDYDNIEIKEVKPPVVAKLVYFNFVTRVVVPSDATQYEVIEAARTNIKAKVDNELHESLEEIINDDDCPITLDELRSIK